MTPVEFLQIELKKVAEKFPNVNIRYGYDDIIDTHVVELLPLIEYNSNDELDKAWIPLSIEFLRKYMNEEIAFISSDSSLSLKDIIFEYNYKDCTEENIISELFAPLTEQTLFYEFPTDIPNSRVIENAFLVYPNKHSTFYPETDFLEIAYPEAA